MHKDKSSMFLESLGRRGAEIGDTVTELLASVLKPAMRETSINMLGITLGSVCVLILFLNSLSGGRARWTNRLCQLNILSIVISLASIKYKFLLGCVPAIIVCGLDMVLCSLYSLHCLYSLLVTSLKTILAAILALSLAAMATMFGQAMIQVLSKEKLW